MIKSVMSRNLPKRNLNILEYEFVIEKYAGRNLPKRNLN